MNCEPEPGREIILLKPFKEHVAVSQLIIPISGDGKKEMEGINHHKVITRRADINQDPSYPVIKHLCDILTRCMKIENNRELWNGRICLVGTNGILRMSFKNPTDLLCMWINLRRRKVCTGAVSGRKMTAASSRSRAKYEGFLFRDLRDGRWPLSAGGNAMSIHNWTGCT
jgi:hypothetical protein